ncbi:hypothetical protein [Streptococcus thermophilus]|uniref:hypothetical protein n=1 Tax=Streptococcus thermophilus TaxID=1308 RepID=UPI0022EB36C6|nr:hypothetical protein [Streptococcus thermophilus]MDA3775813.1 hypothetical protein [Streptococcus thermophilus]
MIFNTVFSLYYSLGKRFSAGSDKRYKFFVAAFALAGFAISFMGFRQLVAVMLSHYWLSGVVDVGCPSCS